MGLVGGFLMFLGLPLIIGYFIGERKNVMWRNLGLIMLGFGLLIVLIGAF